MDKANTASNSKRIAKNTLILYMRMLFMMAISLYTSRVFLQALGISDFGIYSVVGGLVSMFSLISGSISASISRYLTFELGRKNQKRLNLIFSTSLNILFIISGIIIILAETVGLWFLNTKMNFPSDRTFAVNWVYQFSLIGFVLSLISMPYNAAIIAHEKMSAFAYISIIEAVVKLGITFLIMTFSGDRLILFSTLICVLAVLIRFIYVIYCKRNFAECTYHLVNDKPLLKEMFGFAGWNFIGAASAVLRDQGTNILLNIFFGTLVNAASGVAAQVNKAITGFVTNFMTALNPQITKSYASDDKDYMMTLLFRGAKYSYFMLLFLCLPVIFNTKLILSIWLTKVPDYAAIFVQLTLIFAMSESISNPLKTAMLATGRIRNYQIVVGGLQLLNVPISYVLLKLGFSPYWIYINMILISQLCLYARLYMLINLIGLDIKGFLINVYFNVIVVTLLSMIVPIFISFKSYNPFINLVLNCLILVPWTSLMIWFVGFSKLERTVLKAKLKQHISNKVRRH